MTNCCLLFFFVSCTDVSLPFAALQLLAPPVRLVSAALWKVMKQRDVMQYGVLEEVVTSTCETVPGLLTVRHQGKLALGLRGRVRPGCDSIVSFDPCITTIYIFNVRFINRTLLFS